MGRIARVQVRYRKHKDAQQDRKLKALELKTNKAIKKAEEAERLAIANEKKAKAEARLAAARRKTNAKRDKQIADIKKYGKRFFKNIRK